MTTLECKEIKQHLTAVFIRCMGMSTIFANFNNSNTHTSKHYCCFSRQILLLPFALYCTKFIAIKCD